MKQIVMRMDLSPEEEAEGVGEYMTSMLKYVFADSTGRTYITIEDVPEPLKVVVLAIEP